MVRKLSKSFKLIIGIIASILVLILLVFVIGWVVDLATKSSIRKAGDKARLFFSSLQRNEPGNGWDYYSVAIKKCKTLKSSKILSKYLDGRIEATPLVMKTILDNLEIIEKIKEGAKQDYYYYPYDYEKGISAEMPDFMSFRKAADLTIAKSLYDLENGRTDIALVGLFSVITLGKQIPSGTSTLLEQMIGIVIVNRALKVLQIGITSSGFNEEQLEDISEFLDDLEKHWPLLAESFGSEIKLSEISLAANFGKDMGSILLWGNEDSGGSGFIRAFPLRLLCWRSFFSPYRSLHISLIFMENIVNDIGKIEKNILEGKKNKALQDEEIAALNKRIEGYRKKNFFFRITAPNYNPMLRRKLGFITGIRLAGVSSQIEIFRVRKGRFPQNLREIKESDLVDFNTGKLWEYTRFGDSVTLFSPGPDPASEKDDISITLTTLGIKKYLAKRRKKL